MPFLESKKKGTLRKKLDGLKSVTAHSGEWHYFTTTYKNNAQICLKSKVCARLQRLIVLRTIKLASSHCFYTRRYP